MEGEAGERKRFADVGKRTTVFRGRRSTMHDSKDESSSANNTPDRQLVQPLRIQIQEDTVAVCKMQPIRPRADSVSYSAFLCIWITVLYLL